jgi:hypothetical protein
MVMKIKASAGARDMNLNQKKGAKEQETLLLRALLF